jgi:hypothetical protein
VILGRDLARGQEVGERMTISNVSSLVFLHFHLPGFSSTVISTSSAPIGKAERTEDRRLGRIDNKNASTVCFACRQKGHAARECPNVLLAAQLPEDQAGDQGAQGGKPKAKQGMKRAKGQMGSDVAGSGGRCYR